MFARQHNEAIKELDEVLKEVQDLIVDIGAESMEGGVLVPEYLREEAKKKGIKVTE